MSIVGCIAPHPDTPVDIDRILRAVTMGNARTQRRWSGEGARIGAADDSGIATGPGGRVCVFDGRIDYIDDLRRALVPHARDGRDPADLALAAYARWGPDFADRIVGDWACAIWDGTTRRLLLATEPMATRALHYHRAADGTIRFATEARALHADPAVPRELDADRAAHWLALESANVEESASRTFFREIRRVAPGTIVTLDGKSAAISRWWQPLDAPMLHLPSHAAYAEAVGAALDGAIAERIRGDALIGSHLSGGLDSGAVTALAARQLAGEGRRLAAFTAVPVHPHPQAERRFTDEWGHAAATAALYPNVDHVAVSNDDAPLAEVLDRRTLVQDSPLLNMSNTVWIDGIDRAARARGITVMLTGGMGNMTLSYDGAAQATRLIRRGRWLSALGLLTAYRRHMGSHWLGIPATFVDALLPVALARRLRRAAGQDTPSLADWSAIHPDLLVAAGLSAQADASGDLRDRHRGDGRAIRLAVLARSDFRADFIRAARRLYGIDTRDPTMDRRLFELCLAIPEAQFVRNGVPRAIGRTAMAGVLPPMVRDEIGRGLQAADWAVPFDAAVPALKAEVARLRTSKAAPAWIDLDRIDRALAAWRGPEDGEALRMEMLAVTRAVATGRFARAIEGGNA